MAKNLNIKPNNANLNIKPNNANLNTNLNANLNTNFNTNFKKFKGFNKNNSSKISEKEIQITNSINKIISFINNLNQRFFLRSDPNPESPMYSGELPLHIGIRKNYRDIIILALLERCPESAKIKTRNEKLPLHYSLEYLGTNNDSIRKYYEDFIIKLIYAYPNGVTELANGVSPLSLALTKKFSLKIISTLLEISPDQIKTKIFQQYPLYVAINYYRNSDIILYLLEKYPDAAKESYDEKYPLHLAIENKYSYEVISKLLEAYPDAAKIKYKWKTPIDLLEDTTNRNTKNKIKNFSEILKLLQNAEKKEK
jgi:hypothetical protein